MENRSPTSPKAEKEKDVDSLPVGEAACCLTGLFPGKSALPPAPAGSLGTVTENVRLSWVLLRPSPAQAVAPAPCVIAPSQPPSHPGGAFCL